MKPLPKTQSLSRPVTFQPKGTAHPVRTFCPKCGSPIVSGGEFCGTCGAKIS